MTTIEWTDETWNPVTGCEKISQGCAHCYAKQLHDMRHKAHRNGRKMPSQYSTPFELVKCQPARLEIPLRWRKPRLCFVNSMADLFHEDVPDDFIYEVLGTIYGADWHTFQALTKRADRMLRFYSAFCRVKMARIIHARHVKQRPQDADFLSVADIFADIQWPLPNFWPGVSVENKAALFRLDLLRQIPAAVRMVSFEPLLEDLGEVNLQGIGWAIVGGESGGKDARPMHPDWVRSLRDQCIAAGVPFFFKQWGEYLPPLSDSAPSIRPQHLNASDNFIRLGKKKAGALLDGREWREFPKPYPGHQVVRLQRKPKQEAAAA